MNTRATIPGLVSVVIPAYNREAYIRQTIDSVLQQTYTDRELIVVDDGSTDGTRAILEEYADRLSISEHPGRVNKGQSAAINLGLRQARGEFICILDSDDYWEPVKLERQVTFLNQHPEVGLVYANGTAVDESGKYLYHMYPDNHVEPNNPAAVLKDCYFLVPNNSMVRAEVFRKVGFFDETLRSAQDHDMAIRIAEVTRLAYIPDVLFHYRRHSQSISRNHADLRWRNGFLILEKAARRYPYSRDAIRKRKAVLHFRMFQCALESKQGLKGIPHLLKAGIYDPLRAVKVLLGRESTSGLH